MGRLRRRPSSAGRNHRAVAALSAGHFAERNLYRLALAACRGKNRAPATGLSEAVAAGAGANAQADKVRHVLLARDGRCGAVDSHLLGQSEYAAGDGRYRLRELNRNLSGALPW